MSIGRETPYGQFNFLVDLGTGDPQAVTAGFQEVSGLASEVSVIEYRTGNAKTNEVHKITGLAKSSDVTLKRGVIGSLELFQWFDQVRNGDAGALRTVTIQLMNEDHSAVVFTWKLRNARIIKHTSGPLDAKGGVIAIEEIVIAHERLEIE